MGKDASFRPRLSRDELERRRLLAAEDLDAGVKQVKVARKYGVTEGTVSRWARALRASGVEGLHRTKASRPPRLKQEQLETLLEILLDGAKASGFETDIWTTERVVQVVKRSFGVAFHPAHMSRILHGKLYMTYQKPKKRAKERDEEARATWLRTEWEEIKKNSPKARRSRS